MFRWFFNSYGYVTTFVVAFLFLFAFVAHPFIPHHHGTEAFGGTTLSGVSATHGTEESDGTLIPPATFVFLALLLIFADRLVLGALATRKRILADFVAVFSLLFSQGLLNGKGY